jgi:hypothetical protein
MDPVKAAQVAASRVSFGWSTGCAPTTQNPEQNEPEERFCIMIEFVPPVATGTIR